MKKLVITGAAGRVASVLRPLLQDLAEQIVLSDLREVENLSDKESFVRSDLADRGAMRDLIAGSDGIIHLGGIANEGDWQSIRAGNIDGLINLYDAAALAGQPRIVFASSYHVVGFAPQSETLDSKAPMRPDGLYGVSKVFGEALASMYFDKTGQETAVVRIGSCFSDVHSHRMMKTWFSPTDFASLIRRAFAADTLGYRVLYGVSDNKDGWWINDQAEDLGWSPVDSSERFRADVAARFSPPEPGSPDDLLQGGVFTTFEIKSN